MTNVSRNFTDEDVVVKKFLFVTSQKLFVELECSAPLSINLEVLHGFTCFVEILCIFDLDNSGVEWSCKISSDLWLVVNESDFGLFLKSLSNFG